MKIEQGTTLFNMHDIGQVSVAASNSIPETFAIHF